MKRNQKINFAAKFVSIVVLLCLMATCLVLAGCDLHAHECEDVWFSDQTYHWRQCSICADKVDKAEHSVNNWLVVTEPTETQTGLRRGKCSVCETSISEVLPKLDHTHVFDGDYSFDELGHWQTCSCGQKDNFSEHAVTNWIIDSEASETAQGLKHGVCNVCKKTVEEVIPVTGHEHLYSQTLFYDDDYHYFECSCGSKKEVALHSYSDVWQRDAASHWKECDCGRITDEQTHITQWIVDTPATTDSTGSKHEECLICGEILATETIDKLTSSTRSVDFYAINDFHGEVDKISTVGGYLKERKNENANTLLLNSGDMFQGSMESNSNYGKLLTDCMDAIGFDAFAYGNHEFDWGLEKLETLANNSNVPFLGANIYHWNASTKTWGTFADELAQKYVVKTLDNGLKVGIIGVIGEKQITSISSNLVQTIGFKEPLPIIKELAAELRNEQSCDVVVVTAHASPRGLLGESEGNGDPEEPTNAHGLEEYVDAVFCAHTHREQNFLVDGLPFIQGSSYGSKVSHITLSVDKDGGVSCSARENISYSSSWPNILIVDELIDNSNAQIETERNQVLATLNSSLRANPAMARLVSRAIAEYAKNQNFDISLAMVNTARQTLYSGEVTYSELYESIPFDNVVYIAKVKGSDIINEVNYGNYYWRSSGEAIESNKWYTIAVIDYLLYHQNANRNYNYFPSAFTSGFDPKPLTNDNYEVYNYRLITRDYLLANGSIDAADYTYDNNNTAVSLLGSNVTLTYETSGDWYDGETKPSQPSDPSPAPAPKHAGTIYDPYDVADALIVGKDYDSGYNSPSVYVKCVVSNVTYIKQSATSGDLGSFYVRDESGATIKVYYVSKSSDSNNNWSSAEDLQVGDVLVMRVSSYVYNGTPQLGYGYCISINGNPT